MSTARNAHEGPHSSQVNITRLLRDYLELSACDQVVFVNSTKHSDLAQRLVEEASKICEGARLIQRRAGWEHLYEQWATTTAVVFLEATSSTWSGQVLLALSRGPATTRVFRVFDFSPELLAHALAVPREILRALNESIIAQGQRARCARIRSDAGTDLKVHFSRSFGWIDAWGGFDGTEPGILPPGEVATYSDDVSGVLVADGAINTNFGFPGDPRLMNRHVRVTFERSRVQSVSTDDMVLSLLLRKFLTIPFANRVGEVGFGTNVGLREFVPFLSHINERFPALHLGLGGNNQGLERTGWNCDFHLDLILGRCSIEFDDQTIMSDGQYTIDKSSTVVDRSDVKFADTV